MYETSDIKKGLKITMDGAPFVVVEFQFVKPGKGQAFTRTKLKNMITGAVLDKTFKSGEKLEKADLESREMQFLYKDGAMFVFMDTQSYEQIQLSEEDIGDNKYYLLDGMSVDVLMYGERPIDVTPPTFVELSILETEPGFKGDTSGNTTKPAIVETGLKVNVPLFVTMEDVLKIDTRTGEYVERVKK